MGLLNRGNPGATPRTAVRWGVGGGIAGGVTGLVGWLWSDLPTGAVFFLVPWMAVLGAVAGGAIEWQLPPESDEAAEPGVTPDRRPRG